MPDLATPNLPSRDFAKTEKFYRALGFERTFRDDGWMVLKSGNLVLEFFSHPDLDPAESWFSACLHLDALDPFINGAKDFGVPQKSKGWPRIHAPEVEASGLRIGYLIDPDGSLLRLIENS